MSTISEEVELQFDEVAFMKDRVVATVAKFMRPEDQHELEQLFARVRLLLQKTRKAVLANSEADPDRVKEFLADLDRCEELAADYANEIYGLIDDARWRQRNLVEVKG